MEQQNDISNTLAAQSSELGCEATSTSSAQSLEQGK